MENHHRSNDGRRLRRVAIVATGLIGAAALGILLAACTGPSGPSQPPPPPPPPEPTPPAPTGVTVSGTVLEFTASGVSGPVPNVQLKIRWGNDAPAGDLPDTVTDASGRYSIPNVSANVLYLRTAPGSEFRSLCNAWPVFVRRPFTEQRPFTDLPVVHNSWSGNRLPPGMWTMGTTIYGTVSERGDGSLKPIDAATVTDGWALENPPATTSASGFYMSCAILGTDQVTMVTARKAGYGEATRKVDLGNDREINFELTRR